MAAPSLLLVEDEPMVARFSRAMLEEDGYDVLLASNGYEALTLLDERAADFAAVVTDVRLGAGPNGWEVGRHARACSPAIPVLYVTGDSGADWQEKGVDGSVLLTKPFVAARLIDSVDKLVHASDTMH